MGEFTYQEAEDFLSDFYLGKHHIPSKIHEFDDLTRLVFLAHDRCVRVEIGNSGPGMIKIIIHKRHHRDGQPSYERHPTIETALKTWRKTWESCRTPEK